MRRLRARSRTTWLVAVAVWGCSLSELQSGLSGGGGGSGATGSGGSGGSGAAHSQGGSSARCTELADATPSLGHAGPASGWVALEGDHKYGSGFQSAVSGTILAYCLWIGGQGGTGSQSLRGVLYDQDGANVLRSSNDVAFPTGGPAQWVELRFTDAPQVNAGESYLHAVHAAPADPTLQIGTATGGSHRYASDAFDDGAGSFVSAMTATPQLVVFALFDQ
jgi:hypothetical protein